MFSVFRSQKLAVNSLALAELSDIADIHKASFQKAWDEDELNSTIKAKGVHCLAVHDVTKSKHVVIGFLIYRITADEAEIITIASYPNHRRKGVARALMDEMIRICLTERVKEVFLEVDEINSAALTLYKTLSFVKVGERKGYYSATRSKQNSTSSKKLLEKQSSTALIMKLDLTT
ncbi:MAG: ribosomal protein S18-alanine N-acetyltransferase [Rhizobiales bacterium]|nr:ribosomal protein S18-alanine N-acetyltransferase [Hyphomicrobiales bacterium]